MENNAVSVWVALALFYRPLHLENWEFVDECVCVRACAYLCMYTFEEWASAAAYPLRAVTEKFKFTCKVSDEGNQSYCQTLALPSHKGESGVGSAIVWIKHCCVRSQTVHKLGLLCLDTNVNKNGAPSAIKSLIKEIAADTTLLLQLRHEPAFLRILHHLLPTTMTCCDELRSVLKKQTLLNTEIDFSDWFFFLLL